MLIGNMANFLDGNSAAGIHAEGPSVLDDLGHGKLAPLSSISKIATPKNLLSEVASGSVKLSQNVVIAAIPGTCAVPHPLASGR
jgi:hypothetical protein